MSQQAILAGLIGRGIQLSRTPALHEHEGDAQGMRYLYRLIDLDQLQLDSNALPERALPALQRLLLWVGDPTERQALARLTRDIHAPLANRLGIWQLKWELEDLAFRYLQPQVYKQIATQLDEKRTGRERYIAAVIASLQKALAEHGIRAEISGRPKHIYSIWRKMQRKQVGFDELYDLRAVRIAVDDVAACYAALGVVHALWVPIPSEFDDYIARPKSNDYRSLHTAVVGPEGRTLEVQIRTHEMHAQAELGVAAHWKYKEGKGGGDAFDRKIAWMRRLLEGSGEATGEGTLADIIPAEVETPDDITVTQEFVDRIGQAMEKLGAKHREILILRNVKNLSYEEIAEILGKPYRPLPASLLSGALRLLKPLGLSQYGPEQLDFLRYRPVLTNQRLKEEFGYQPRYSSREAFFAFLTAQGISYHSSESQP